VSLIAFIERIGIKPWFIALNAHCWGAAWWVAAIVQVCIRFRLPWHWIVPVAVILASIKEFYLDATLEVPQQTWRDNAGDFAGYFVGIAIGAFTHLL